MELPIFKLLTGYAMKQKFGVHIGWSHITRAYDCELREIVYFKNSGQPYMLPRVNRGGANPLEALVNALREALPSTPMLSVLFLEAEVKLLELTWDRVQEFERKLGAALDDLRAIIDSIPVVLMVGDEIVAEPVPLHTLRSKPIKMCMPLEDDEPTDLERWTSIILKGEVLERPKAAAPLPADPGEDDDL